MNQPENEIMPAAVIRPGFAWDAQDAYLFDIDGTLLRSRDRIHYHSFAASVERVLGRTLTLDGIPLHGNTDTGILAAAFRQAGIADEEWRPQLGLVLAAMGEAVTGQKERLQLVTMPGVEQVLRHLEARGALLGVGTGNLEVIGWLKIEQARLREWFHFGGFSDHFDDRRQLIAAAAAQARRMLGREGSVCVVGDTPADIDAAHASGLPVIAVATGNFSLRQLLEHSPEVAAPTLAALLGEDSSGHVRG